MPATAIGAGAAGNRIDKVPASPMELHSRARSRQLTTK